MTAALLLPAALSFLLLSAHFLRSGELPVVVLSVAAAGLLAVRRPWAARSIQAGLFLAAAEWVRTIAGLTALRRAAGAPWIRMAAFLGATAALAVAAGVLFETKTLRRFYGFGIREGRPEAPDSEITRETSLSSSRHRGRTFTDRSRK